MPTALITGSTEGIGAALALELEGVGWRVIRHGRRPFGELPPAPFEEGDYCRADLCDPESAADGIRHFLADLAIPHLDLLIHNAAVGYAGRFADQDPKGCRELIATNLLAPIAITRELAPLLTAVSGKVVFVGSAITPLPCPEFATYTATKAALASFARSVRAERGIRVQVVHPGPTRTRLHQKSGYRSPKTESFRDPAAVGSAIRRAVLRSDRDRVLGPGNRALFAAGRLGRPGLAKWGHRRSPDRPRAVDPGSRDEPHCVITGGSQGIGAALAATFRSGGYRVTTVDRQPDADIVADLSTAAGVEAALAELAGVDLFVHNAGINSIADFTRSDPAANRAVLDVNFVAPALLTAALAHSRRPPDFIFVASLSCQLGYPGAATYAASKDGVASLAASIHAAGLRTLTVFPGPTRTEHAARHSPDNSRAHRRMPPEELARRIYRAYRKGRSTLIPGAANRILAAAGTALPGAVSRLMRRAMRPRDGAG